MMILKDCVLDIVLMQYGLSCSANLSLLLHLWKHVAHLWPVRKSDDECEHILQGILFDFSLTVTVQKLQDSWYGG